MNFSKSKHHSASFRLVGLSLLLFLYGCLEPTRPEFQLEESFFLVEGRMLRGEGEGEIRIRQSDFREVQLQLLPINEAEVLAVEAGGASVRWELFGEEGSYRPPGDFMVSSGERWHFEITLPDGTMAVSDEELVPEPVPVNNLEIQFEQNSVFDDGLDRFIPRFELFIDFQDPADQENYYSYDYRYWEETFVCISCQNGRYSAVEQRCIPEPDRGSSFMFRYDYLCDSLDCFTLSNGNEPKYGTDEFFNGGSPTGFPIGGIPFQGYGGLLVEAFVYSISPEAFAYGKVIQDLTEGNSGLNATIPSALNGNVRNLDPAGRDVLGFIGVAAGNSTRAFITRSVDTGSPLPFDNSIRLEPIPPPGVPPRAPCDIPGKRTSQKPVGWP